MKENLNKKLIFLLREYALKIEELQPELSWNTYRTLTTRIESVAQQLEEETYDVSNFWFSDFNGKSAEGEILEWLNGSFPELKKSFINIENELYKISKSYQTDFNFIKLTILILFETLSPRTPRR